ncbi:MAG: hypothetical protein FJX75_09340 [Armatimonadetes bacterium]|nr:hypothetical protein [Armatimonadota bacterium]
MRLLALATAFALAATASAQLPAPGALALWTFDDGVGDLQSADPEVTLKTTQDANVTRGEGHGAVLEYSFVAAAGKLGGVFAPMQANVGAARTLRFWMRTSDPCIVLANLSETDGSAYHAGFVSLPDRWQEIALDVSEFQLGDDSTDENGRLDPDQIAGLGIVDATGFLAQLAASVPFLIAPELGPRIFWLDDLSLSSEPVPPRWSVTQVDGKRAVRLDSFESSPLQWLALAGKGTTVDYDRDYRAEGDFSLRLQYDLPPNKIVGIMTSPQGPDLRGMKHLRLWLMTEVATDVIVSLKERDESDYHQRLDLQPSDKLQLIDIDLSTMTLGDDSQDENGQFDLDQVKELSLADVSMLTGKPVSVNTLWIDDVVFTE